MNVLYAEKQSRRDPLLTKELNDFHNEFTYG